MRENLRFIMLELDLCYLEGGLLILILKCLIQEDIHLLWMHLTFIRENWKLIVKLEGKSKKVI